MSNRLVLVATFSQAVEAQLALARLEVEGVKGYLGGGETASIFSGAAGPVRLEVAEIDALRAVAILSAYGPGHFEEEERTSEGALWVCPLCGDAVSEDLPVCPSCATDRPPARESTAVTAVPKHNPASQDVQPQPSPNPVQVTADTPLEAVPSAMEDDLDLPDVETFIGDDLVRRAFLSALFGFLCFLITLYSFWTLGQLALFQGKISPRMMPRLYAALAIDLLVFVFYVLIFGRLTYH